MSLPNFLTGFARHAAVSPAAEAFSVDGRSISYGEASARVKAIAGWLSAQGPGGEQRVGVLGGRCASGFYGLLASYWQGAMAVPLNVKMPLARLAAMIQRAQLTAVLVDGLGEKAQAELGGAIQCPVLRTEVLASEQSVGSSPWLASAKPADLAPQQNVYLMFTSGTTGEPKGIAATADNLRHYLDFMQARHQIVPGDRLSQLFELSFDASVFDFLMALNHGASFHSVPDNQLLAPAAFIREKKLTSWFGVPSNIAFMEKMRLLKPGVFPNLRLSIFGGEPFPAALARAWQRAAPNAKVDNVYGPTEATVTCYVQPCDEPLAVTPERDVVAIGRPYRGMMGAIVNDAGEFLDAGVTGELVLAGPQVTPGYWGDDHLTRQRFVNLRHPVHGLQRWYLTGDLAYCDQAGVFHHLGRKDHQVKVSGQRVELEDIEAHLRDAAQCGAVAAVAWPMEQGSARGIVAFVCGSRVDAADIRAAMRRSLPPYMVPARVITLAELPYTLNGKVDRKKLRELLDSQQV